MSEPLIIAASMAAVFVGTIVLVWIIMYILGRSEKYE
jgi:hypothetical protein